MPYLRAYYPLTCRTHLTFCGRNLAFFSIFCLTLYLPRTYHRALTHHWFAWIPARPYCLYCLIGWMRGYYGWFGRTRVRFGRTARTSVVLPRYTTYAAGGPSRPFLPGPSLLRARTPFPSAACSLRLRTLAILPAGDPPFPCPLPCAMVRSGVVAAHLHVRLVCSSALYHHAFIAYRAPTRAACNICGSIRATLYTRFASCASGLRIASPGLSLHSPVLRTYHSICRHTPRTRRGNVPCILHCKPLPAYRRIFRWFGSALPGVCRACRASHHCPRGTFHTPACSISALLRFALLTARISTHHYTLFVDYHHFAVTNQQTPYFVIRCLPILGIAVTI